MTRLAIALFLPAILCGCAHNDYAVIPNGPGSQSRMSSDLQDCVQVAIHEHFAQEDHTKATALGIGLGPVGGIINETTQPESNNTNRLVEVCMRKRGYIGTSSG